MMSTFPASLLILNGKVPMNRSYAKRLTCYAMKGLIFTSA
ncbi:hypothetical protein BANRA_00017 [Klebsiella pneumoniae]|nr:hypothetical protein BANRA_00017 [Klebsiella pneumoniae]VXZ82542.1 Uncharacterised protein [Klebsiella pneumoniae]